ncbi:MAG: B12-binding domain-containing radical SAM protein [Desulfobacterales bacterium]|nr:B12-binding domain-containing radical SAM protein [Desulfobacterales bacterium]
MRILLIEPESNYKAPNLGLLFLSNAISQSRHEALLLDFNGKPIDDPATRVMQLIDSHEIAIIGISVCDVNYQWSVDLIRQLKKKRAITVVVGGPQVNSLKESVLTDNAEIDYAFAGECEESIVNFLDFIEAGGDGSGVPGLLYRNGKTIKQVNQNFISSLDELPFPDYSHLGIEHVSGYMLLTSRGCPYRCTFCCRNTGNVWRPRSLAECIEEIRIAKEKLAIKSFRIIDASFNINEHRVIQFCQQAKESKNELPWMVSGIRADRLTEKSVAALKDAGCEMLAVGVESLDPVVFRRINKGETIADIMRAINLGHKYDIEVACYMIHGLPGDSYERSISYARKLQALRPSYVMYNHAIPFPGTELHNWVTRHGHFNADFSWLQTRDVEKVAFWTDDFTEEERLKSFRIIQTITHVINFSSEDPNELSALEAEIKEHDPEYLVYHLDFVKENLNRKGNEKNYIKRFHQETDIGRRSDYTGCVNVKTHEMV